MGLAYVQIGEILSVMGHGTGRQKSPYIRGSCHHGLCLSSTSNGASGIGLGNGGTKLMMSARRSVGSWWTGRMTTGTGPRNHSRQNESAEGVRVRV